jgi:hypothetical protein
MREHRHIYSIKLVCQICGKSKQQIIEELAREQKDLTDFANTDTLGKPKE